MKWLVDDARKWYKMATIRFWIAVGVLAQLADLLSPTVRGMFSEDTANAISVIAAVSVGLRLYKQGGMRDNSNNDPEVPVDNG